jgi:hypothetical protein
VTPVDHRRAPNRASHRNAASPRTDSSTGRDEQPVSRHEPSHSAQSENRPAGRAEARAARKKPNRSHSAVGAAIVAGVAMVATVAFIITNGTSSSPSADESLPPLPAASAPVSAPAQAKQSANPAPAASTAKADRKPPAATKTAAPPNTGPASPAFKRGQWIAVLDTYPTDAGLEADKLAKNLAAKLIAEGVPAKALWARGQYPGLASSSGVAVSDAWVVYLGPSPSSEGALDLCLAPKTQKAYTNAACPTYEPASSLG